MIGKSDKKSDRRMGCLRVRILCFLFRNLSVAENVDLNRLTRLGFPVHHASNSFRGVSTKHRFAAVEGDKCEDLFSPDGPPASRQCSRYLGPPQKNRPFEKFATLIERHWDGIAAYCTLRKKRQVGFVEGLNNKICMIQRRPMAIEMRRISGSRF